MEHKEELIEKVERYLSGELSRKEVKEDTKEELSSEELDKAIEVYTASKDLIELSGLREDLKSIHEDYVAETEKPGKRSSIRIWGYSAAAAALLAIAVFSGIFKSGNPEFEDFFEPYPNIVSMRGTEGDINEAMRLYTLEKYKEAMAEFSKVDTDSLKLTVLFYEAISALAINDLDKAINNFRVLSESPNNTYWQQTKWYLALALWQNGQIEESKAQLISIGRGESHYEKAQKLLDSF